MVLYAWCGSSLKDHSINTVKAVLAIPRLRRIAEVLALKLQVLSSELSYVDAGELVFLPLAFHDLGKACNSYQSTVKVESGKCGASFKYHEVLSAVFVAEALSLVPQLKDSIKYVVTSAVLNHHYVMRTYDEYRESIHEVLKLSCSLAEEVAELIEEIRNEMNLRSRLVNKVVDELVECASSCRDLRRMLNWLLGGIKELWGGYAFLKPSPDFKKLPRYIASALTGLVNISDSVSAYCERRGNNVFVEELLKELEISCDSITKHSLEQLLKPPK